MSARTAVVPFGRRGGAEGTPDPEVPPLTYQDLIRHHLRALRTGREGRAAEAPPPGTPATHDSSLSNPDTAVNQTERNHLTALNDWMEEKGLNRRSPVGSEFGPNFEAELEKHNRFLLNKRRRRGGRTVRGLGASTIRNRLSLLEQWRAARDHAEQAACLPKTLPEALRHLAALRGETITELGRGGGIHRTTISKWTGAAVHPTAASLPDLRRLEEHCGLEPGALTSLVTGRRAVARAEAVPRTSFGERQRRAVFETYRLKELPPRARAEWDELYALMTPELEPRGAVRRHLSWHVDAETGRCPGGDRIEEFFKTFYGYLCLPLEGTEFPIRRNIDGETKVISRSLLKGHGLGESDLTMALVGDTRLVEEFIEFVRLRAGDYNGETLFILRTCRQLLRPETGFVRQHPDFGRRLSPPVPAGEWDAFCDAAHLRYSEREGELEDKNLIAETRPADEPIRHILKLPHPMDALFDLADAMAADLPTASAKVDVARHFRDLLLVKMLTANPLRIKHFALMTYRPDNTGNLYRAEDGWRLRYRTEFFKNQKFLKKRIKRGAKRAEDYDAALPPSLQCDIEEYLFIHRQHLIGADACDYVFRPARMPHTKKDKSGVGDPMDIHSLSSLLKFHTRHYLKCAGFGPHAFRHIIATEYIKNHLNGYEVAARILHESPETVRERYAHLEHSDYFGHWVNYHEDQRERVRNGRRREVHSG